PKVAAAPRPEPPPAPRPARPAIPVARPHVAPPAPARPRPASRPVAPAAEVLPAKRPARRRAAAFLLPLLPVAFLLAGLALVLAHDLLVIGRDYLVGGGPAPEGQRIQVLFHDTEEQVVLGEGGVKPENGM